LFPEPDYFLELTGIVYNGNQFM